MTFEDYYNDVYLPRHSAGINRALHVVGTLCSFGVFIGGLATLSLGLTLLSFLVPYPFAWFGHFLEGNKPVAWNGPLRARLADWRMTYETIKAIVWRK
jgi:hypothetical protein